MAPQSQPATQQTEVAGQSSAAQQSAAQPSVAAGSTGAVPDGSPPSSDAWVPLQLALGLPLVPEPLNELVCDNAAVRLLCHLGI